MKKLLLILFLSPLITWSQNTLFTSDTKDIISATKDPNMTIGLIVNDLIEKKIIGDRPDEFQL